MRELVTSKMTKVLSECLILRCGNDGLNVIRIAMLKDKLFHDKFKRDAYLRRKESVLHRIEQTTDLSSGRHTHWGNHEQKEVH